MKSVSSLVRRIRAELRRGGSPAHVRSLQRFFKEPIRAYGWRTAKVRKLAARLRREIIASGDGELLLAVAERLFRGPTLEEASLAVTLLERLVRKFGDAEFRRLERWLPWIGNWGACDSLGCALIGPMIAADQGRLPRVFRWAKSKNRWHRRMAAVSLVPAARRGMCTAKILRLSDGLLPDKDDMVQKGVGWLLKVTGQAKPREVVAYLMRVRRRAPRLVLRIACEKLPRQARQRILG